MTIAAVIGFITLIGIATHNGVILVDHIRRLIRDEGIEGIYASFTVITPAA